MKNLSTKSSMRVQRRVPKMLKGIDISHYQGDIKWDVIKAAGFDFVFMKSSQGLNADPTFETHWNYLNKNSFGLIKSAYHFFDTSLDPEAQAEKAYSLVGMLKDADMPMVVDIETDRTNGALVLADRIKNLQAFLNLVEKLSGKRPIIYTDHSFFVEYFQNSTVFGGYLLWIASYPDSKQFMPTDPPPDHQPHLPLGFTKWTFWQYTENGLIPGADDAGNIFDMNVFNGTLEDLQAIC